MSWRTRARVRSINGFEHPWHSHTVFASAWEAQCYCDRILEHDFVECVVEPVDERPTYRYDVAIGRIVRLEEDESEGRNSQEPGSQDGSADTGREPGPSS